MSALPQVSGHEKELDIMQNENAFLDYVISVAEGEGKLFVLDCGEGRDFVDPKTGWYIEDLSGWLIHPQDKDRFAQSRKDGTAYKSFSDCYNFVVWSLDSTGNIKVSFQRFKYQEMQ
ncbi:MAG: hypothetical protein LBG99_04670 [Propionibacteriaceae bacterium]|nr:hypothetical protein [Propionibacteriaceae bacterium]